MSLASEIARRYASRGSSRLFSSVAALSAAGIAIGVGALVIAMGLLTGYREEIAAKLLGANAEVVVFPLSAGGIEDPEALARRLRTFKRVTDTSAVIYAQGVASSPSDDGTPVILKGIDPASEARVASVVAALPMMARALATGPDGIPGCAIGEELARRLGVVAGDRIEVAIPDASHRGDRFALRRRTLRVARSFRTNFFEYDSGWIFVDRARLRELMNLSSPANVLEIKLDTMDDTPTATRRIRDLAGDGFTATDWRSMNGGLFSALAIQKTTLFLLIGLVVAVAAFSVVATLVIKVREKTRDIAILSVLGASPTLPGAIFRRLGFLLTGAGIAAGLAGGIAVCQILTRFRLVSFPPAVAQIYFVSFVPFVVRGGDIGLIVTATLVCALGAGAFAGRRAGRISAADALRYE